MLCLLNWLSASLIQIHPHIHTHWTVLSDSWTTNGPESLAPKISYCSKYMYLCMLFYFVFPHLFLPHLFLR